MTIYTFSQARQNFASVLEKARKEGQVVIKRKDGSFFLIKPLSPAESPLDVEGVNLALSRDEIVSAVREARKR